MPDAPAPDVSVIVAARNAEGPIAALLGGLAAQTLARERFEVIVVDDGSEDRTGEIAARAEDVLVIGADGHVGLPAARNLGIRAAGSPIVAFTDADCIPAADWLQRGLERFEADPELTVLGSRVTIPLGDDPSVAELLDAARHFDQEAYLAHGFLAGGAMFVRRRALLDAGGLNERLAAYGHEDVELSRLLVERGAKLGYAPEARLTHPPRRSLGELASKSYRLGEGLAALRRHARGGGRDRALLLRPWLLLPNPRLRGERRLRDRGIALTPSLRARLLAAQYLFCDLPYFAGDAVATVARLLGGRRS